MLGQQIASFGLAAAAAVGNAVANVMQRKASLEQPPDVPFSARLLLRLVRSPTWLLGFGGLVASFVLQAIALNFGELSAVEPVITLEVPLTLLFASFVFSARLGRREWVSILSMTGGMILLVAALRPRGGNAIRVDDVTYALAGGATAATIVALTVLGYRHRSVLFRTAALGAAAGTSFGLTATLIKETVTELTRRGLVGMLSTWQTYAAVGFGILGLLLVQNALHIGPLVAAQPGFTLMDPVVSILWGVLVYDEMTRTGVWLVPAVVGAVVIGFSVFELARSPLLAAVNSDLEAQENANRLTGAGNAQVEAP